MKFAALFQHIRTARTNTDDRAVSPVIGVILMIAITVVLAAVVGSMALGLGGSVQAVAPNANFQFEYVASGGAYEVTATHMGGDSITAQNAQSLALTAATGETVNFALGVSAGESATLNGADVVAADTTVRVVWTSTDGESSQTLATGRTPA